MDHHFPQNSFRILALDEKRSQHMIFQFSSMGNLWIASWWDLPNKILSMRPGFFSTAVGAAYALFNAFEFSRKISLNVIWKNVKDDGSRIHFVVRNFLCILLLQRQQTFGRLMAYKINYANLALGARYFLMSQLIFFWKFGFCLVQCTSNICVKVQ